MQKTKGLKLKGNLQSVTDDLRKENHGNISKDLQIHPPGLRTLFCIATNIIL